MEEPWLVHEALAAGVAGRALEEHEARAMIEEVARRFVAPDAAPSWNLWDRFARSTSRPEPEGCRPEPEGWRRVASVVADADGPVVVLGESGGRWYGFAFERARDVEGVLAECPFFEEFAVSADLGRVACFNHHDLLIVAEPLGSWISPGSSATLGAQP